MNTANKNENESRADYSNRVWRPRLSFFHPNAKGSGSAIRFELHPAHDDTDGSIWATIANQVTVGDLRGATPIYPRFDWQDSICVKLDFSDLTKMLQVMRGEAETIEDGKGLCHRGVKAITHIHLRHVIDPRTGYMFELYRSGDSSSPDKGSRIFLRPNEALGLRLAIENSMSVICFGIPMVIPRDTSAYRAAVKEQKNGTN